MSIDNYELVYDNLVKNLANIDLAGTVEDLGGYLRRNQVYIEFFGTPYLITEQGIGSDDGGAPPVPLRIILCRYVLQAGRGELSGEWVSYRDFRDSAFFIANFQENAEEPLAGYFGGNPGDLGRAAGRLGGRSYRNSTIGDLCYQFQALPKVPLLLVFYDRDEEFPASCKLLFDRSAPVWLDMECLAVLGSLTADLLIKKAKEFNYSLGASR